MASLFSHLLEAPADPILGTAIAFKADNNPNKVNLGIGAYRTEEGKPHVFPVVQAVQDQLCRNQVDKEYLPIDGLSELKSVTQKLIFGNADNKIASTQTLSGTGALRVAGEFFIEHLPNCRTVYLSDPTWGNHVNVFQAAGFAVKKYAYWKNETKSLDFPQMLADLRAATPHSLVVLHACAHNPTGMDPTQAQWKEILEVLRERELIPFFDSAYQGYASGDLDKDAYSIRMCKESGMEMILAQSFAKNMGLYGERIGMLHIVCNSEERASVVLSQLKMVIRRMYSSPPGWGARIVLGILSDEKNCEAWKEQLKAVAARINRVRGDLHEGLLAKGTPGNWDHVTRQIGMFSFTGLTPEQCTRMINKWHIYLLKSGRISVAGLNSSNLQYVVDAIDDCVRSSISSHL